MSSNKALITDIPYALGFGVPEALVRYERGDFAANYAIGNMPWLSAASEQNPISRITTTYQKERLDLGSSAGENSLSNWWLRSATSWHRGEGLTFYDAATDDLYRFRESANVDVWTPGRLTMLNDAHIIALANAHHPATTSAGTWMISGGTVYLLSAATLTLTAIAGITGAQALTSDGQYALVGTANGVYEVSPAGTVRHLYAPQSGGVWTVNSIAYVKNRIVVGTQTDDTVHPMHIFELGREPGSTPTSVNNSTYSRYADKGVTFPSITATSGAILVGSTRGVVTQVLSFTIDMSAGGLGSMNDPVVVAELPRGETLNQIRSYLNAYVALATTKGLRIGVENSAGDGFTYGQLVIDSEVRDLAFSGEYVYATRYAERAGARGLWRINLGEPVGDSYAHAADLSGDIAEITGVAFIGDTGLLAFTDANGVWTELEGRYAETGYISSGWVRYGTTELKQPVSVMIRTYGTEGTVGFSVTDSDENLANFDSLPLDMALNVPLSSSLLANQQHEVTLSLIRGTDPETTPVVEEWQLRALPAPVRSRTITLPLRCYNEETDSNGVRNVSDPWERLKKLELLEQSGAAVLFQDFSTGEERICQIKAVQFEQVSPPSYVDGFGGTVTVQLQTIDVEIA